MSKVTCKVHAGCRVQWQEGVRLAGAKSCMHASDGRLVGKYHSSPQARRAADVTVCTSLPAHLPSASPLDHLQATLEFHYGKHHTAYLNNLNAQVGLASCCQQALTAGGLAL